MMVHGNVELLSSFVDDELEAPQRAAVESHLAGCPRCRERIGSLRRVVAELQALEQAVTPPAGLGVRVRRAVLFERERTGGLRRSAESLRRWTDQPLLLPLFGVVTAMAVLLYLFSAWSDRAEHPGTRLVVGSERDAAATPAVEGTVVELEQRTFERIDGRWIERGVDFEEVETTLDLRRPLPEHAALEPFRPLGGRVVLLDGGRPVEVLFGPVSP